MVASIQRSVGEVPDLKVSFLSCDCQQEDATLFDASNPDGKYKVLVLAIDWKYVSIVVECLTE